MDRADFVGRHSAGSNHYGNTDRLAICRRMRCGRQHLPADFPQCVSVVAESLSWREQLVGL